MDTDTLDETALDRFEPTDEYLVAKAARRAEAIAGLRELANFLEQHPEATLPQIGVPIVYDYQPTRREFLEQRRTLGGQWDKRTSGEHFEMRRDFGPYGYLLYVGHEQVCERVQVGVETVTVPDPEAVAALPKVEREEPQFEWRCPESLLAEVTGE